MDKNDENLSTEVKSHSIILWLIAFILILVAACSFNYWFYSVMAEALVEQTNMESENCVAALNINRINQFHGNEEDKNPQYNAVKRQLIGILELYPHFADIRILKKRPDGSLYTLLGFNKGSERIKEIPYGEPFQNNYATIQKVFLTNVQRDMTSPGEGGRWYRFTVLPIPNPRMGTATAVMLTGMDAQAFSRVIHDEVFPSVILSILLVAVVFAGMCFVIVGRIGNRSLSYLSTYVFALSGGIFLTILFLAFGKFDNLHMLNEFISTGLRNSHLRDSLITIRDNEFHFMRNFLENEKLVDRETFSVMLEQINKVPEIRYWNWIHIVPDEKRAAYEKELSEQFVKDGRIWQYNAAGKPVAAVQRPFHYSLVSMTNPDSWQLFHAEKPGFDVLSLSSNTPLLSILQEAERTQITTATDFLPPIPDTDIGWHQELALGVKDPLSGKMKGFIIGIFEPQHLLDISVGGLRQQVASTVIDFVMVNPNTGNAMILASTDPQRHVVSYSMNDLLTHHRHLVHACVAFGRTYATITHPTDAFFAAHRKYGQSVVLLFGIPMLLLGTFLVYLFNRHHLTLEKLVNVQSATLVKTEKRAAALSRTGESLSQRLHAITENVQDIIWEIDMATKTFVYISPNVMKIFGIPRERFLGKTVAELGLFNDLSRFEKRVSSVLSGSMKDGFVCDEEETHTPDGRTIWLEISSNANLDPETGHIIWSGVSRVVTDRKKREQFNRVIFGTLHAIASNRDIKKTFQDITQVIRKETGIDAVAIRQANASYFPYVASSGYAKEFLAADHCGEISSGKGSALEETVFCSLLNREPVAEFSVTDLGSYWTNQKRGADSFASRAFLPFFDANNKMAGLLQLEDHSVGCFTKDVIAQLEFIASHVGELVIRKRVESDFQAIFLQMEEAVLISEVILDKKGVPCDLRFVYCNPAFSRLCRKPEAEVIGHTLSAVFPHNLQSWLTRLHESAASSKPVHQSFFEERIGRFIEQTLFRIDETQYACAITDVTERKLAERDLHDAMTFVSGGIFKYSAEVDDYFTFISQNMLAMLGYTEEEFKAKFDNRFSNMVYVEDRERAIREINEQIARGDSDNCEYRIETKSGLLMWVYDVGHLVIDESGKRWFYVYITDITARKVAEQESGELRDQLAQATKMESIGRFAGGVAHDFNNMLQAILGYAEMGLMDINAGSPGHEDMASIQEAARKAADLTSQLLIFAKKAHSVSKSVEVNAAIDKIAGLLQRLIGSGIALNWRPCKEPCKVWIDPSRFDQIVMNLCVNARDAIGSRNGGEIILRCGLREVKQSFATTTGSVVPGVYVVISVLDNGSGIPAENISHIFEPFFTTKAKGKGTGLGLATVYGIVNECNGGILLTSTPGKGSFFEIFLPRDESTDKDGESGSTLPALAPAAPKAGLTVLLVDDEEPILNATRRILESLKYSVIATSSSRKAVEIFREKHDTIDLVLSDVIMPELRGPDMIAEMLKIRKNIPYLYISGYTANLLTEQGMDKQVGEFIAKPFSRVTLARKIAETLGKKDGRKSAEGSVSRLPSENGDKGEAGGVGA